MSEDAIRKRAEREERKRKEREAAAAAEGENLSQPAPSYAPPSAPQPSNSELKADIPYTIVVPASSREFEWYAPGESSTDDNAAQPAYPNFVYTSISSARAAGIWDYPSTAFERARCGVFHDLWTQGYFMGGGIKFGGEYLVYPGTFYSSNPCWSAPLIIFICWYR